MERMKRVTVLCVEGYGKEWPPEDARAFLDWFASHFERIPPEYMHTAKVEIVSQRTWEDSEPTIEISYTRPETEEEAQAYQDDENRRLAQRERMLLQELEAVRAKKG